MIVHFLSDIRETFKTMDRHNQILENTIYAQAVANSGTVSPRVSNFPSNPEARCLPLSHLIPP